MTCSIYYLQCLLRFGGVVEVEVQPSNYINWFPRKFSTGLGTSTTFGGVVEVEVILIGEGVVEVGERCGKGEI